MKFARALRACGNLMAGATQVGPLLLNSFLSAAASVMLTTIALSAPAFGASTESLLKRWYALEDVCRGSAPSPKTERACNERDNVVSRQLEARGYCYTGVFGADTHWEYTGSRAVCDQIKKRNEAEAQRQLETLH
jgi:hypothetical protein